MDSAAAAALKKRKKNLKIAEIKKRKKEEMDKEAQMAIDIGSGDVEMVFIIFRCFSTIF